MGEGGLWCRYKATSWPQAFSVNHQAGEAWFKVWVKGSRSKVLVRLCEALHYACVSVFSPFSKSSLVAFWQLRKTHMCIYLIPTQLFWVFKSRNGRHVFLSQVVPEPRRGKKITFKKQRSEKSVKNKQRIWKCISCSPSLSTELPLWFISLPLGNKLCCFDPYLGLFQHLDGYHR